jgi:DNA-binding MarR family transcriptional regulator/N-acetylglutamate synthase-like GNAT family acetyltransferase
MSSMVARHAKQAVPNRHSSERIESIRRFNRFYTKQIGVLREGLLESAFSLTEVRVLYELAHAPSATATQLTRDLDLDAGYLSRMLRRLEQNGLLRKSPSPDDRRQLELSLTAKGRKTFAELDERSNQQVAAMLERLPDPEQRRLVGAMAGIEGILGEPRKDAVPYILRPPHAGDMGWVVHRHGALYAQEYQWDERFEALVAEIVAKFVQQFDSKRERCWIAEREGEIVGSVFLVKQSDTVAKLRLLLVEPKARGLGIGHRLVDECMRFARQAGYKKMTLWTNSVLTAARRIYEQAGFKLTEEHPYNDFGHDLISQTWDLDL